MMGNIEGSARAPHRFYRHPLQTLQAQGVPFLVGGAFAFARYTGIRRHTKDLDLFIRRRDWAALARLAKAWATAPSSPSRTGSARCTRGDDFVDLIFSSGNGCAPVDDALVRARRRGARCSACRCKLAPAEEMIWSKAFIMERERYDGADVAHLLHARGDRARLAAPAAPLRRALARAASHLVLFGFIYPGERAIDARRWLMDDLLERLRHETREPPPQDPAVRRHAAVARAVPARRGAAGLRGPRLSPASTMTPPDVEVWTDAIGGEGAPALPEAPPPARKERSKVRSRRG